MKTALFALAVLATTTSALAEWGPNNLYSYDVQDTFDAHSHKTPAGNTILVITLPYNRAILVHEIDVFSNEVMNAVELLEKAKDHETAAAEIRAACFDKVAPVLFQARTAMGKFKFFFTLTADSQKQTLKKIEDLSKEVRSFCVDDKPDGLDKAVAALRDIATAGEKLLNFSSDLKNVPEHLSF